MILEGSARGGSALGPLDYKSLLKAAEAALKEGAQSVISDFRGATANWTHKPSFVIKGPFMKGGGNKFTLTIQVWPGPGSEIFGYVDRGTQPRFIFPRRKRYLAYRSQFTPKTRPGDLFSGPGGKEGPYTRRRAVSHPGITPRRFSETSAANHQAWWNSRVDRLAYEWCVQVVAGRVTVQRF